jgi:hypothetical protein
MHENHILKYFYILELIKSKDITNIKNIPELEKINTEIKIINKYIETIKYILKKYNVYCIKDYDKIKLIIIKYIIPQILANTDHNCILKHITFENSNFMKVYMNQLGKLYNNFNNSCDTYKSIYIMEIIDRLKNIYLIFGKEIFEKVGIKVITNKEYNNYIDKDKIKYFISISIKLITYFNNLVYHIDLFNTLFNSFKKSDDIIISRILTYLY